MNMVWLKIGQLRPDWAAVEHGARLASLCGWLLMALLAVWLWRAARSLALAQRQLRGDLARIFEQLDLLRLDAQQLAVPLAEARPAAAAGTDIAAPDPAASRVAPAIAASRTAVPQTPADYRTEACDYHAAARLAARGSSAAEIAERCGLVGGEARVLVALQQARARRVEAA